MGATEDFRKGRFPHLEGKYPAKDHAKRVADHIRASGFGPDGLIYLESQKTRLIEDNDTAQRFRCEPFNLPLMLKLLTLASQATSAVLLPLRL
jgi:hypothetical protein